MGAHILADTSIPGALPLSYLGKAPKAGFEPATPASQAKYPHPHYLKNVLRRKLNRVLWNPQIASWISTGVEPVTKGPENPLLYQMSYEGTPISLPQN